jgi:hypothetical protein
MSTERTCPKCGSALEPPKTFLILGQPPPGQPGFGLPVPGLGGGRQQIQFDRCTKCDYVEMHDPTFDIPPPVG